MQKIFFLLLLTSPIFSKAQLTGRVMDAKGEPIPFANIYVENTTHGTTANTEGYYSLDVNGTQSIVFQSIGYKKRVESVTILGKKELNVRLENADLELAEVIIKANAEDPAYPIIRQAIAMRTTYREQVPRFSCDVYIKGVQKIMDAPTKIFGQKVGDMGGALDTNTRQGIVYLSETISKLFVDGDKKREELKSSKVSGNDNGFGFNRATNFDFSFYDKTININREILSPIADNAFTYYRYKLLGQFKDAAGNTVYKIEVIAKRDEDPTWSGDIYIVDNQWNIYQTDLYVTGKSIQQSVLDTLYLRQTFVPIQSGKEPIWRLLSQNVDFKLGIFGFKIGGKFYGVFSNYLLTPQYQKGFFSNETFKAQRGANDNDLQFWDTLRAIPLTLEERNDYIKKDSIQLAHQNPVWIDSTDRKSNKFKPLDLLSGYTYRNSWNRWSVGFDSPLSTIQFNPVQGFALSLPFTYSKRYGERFKPFKSSLEIAPSVSYGFSERKVRADGRLTYLFNRFNYARLTVEGGQKLIQFNENNPIASPLAQAFMLYEKQNWMPLFEKTFFRVAYGQEIVNGLTANVSYEFADRRSVNTNSQYSFRKKDRLYNPNIPLSNFAWENHQAHLTTLDLTWRPKQEYSTYPMFKSIEGSKYPTFSLRVQNIQVGSMHWQKLRLQAQQSNMNLGIAGNFEWKVEYGVIPPVTNRESPQFIDYQHFNGNETHFSNEKNYLNGFFQLPFYQFSTRREYFMAHAQQHFEGFIFDKIPLIRKLQFKEVVRVAYLYTPELGNYAELGFGIDNIGFKLVRPLRFDVSWSYQNGVFEPKPKFMIGIKL